MALGHECVLLHKVVGVEFTVGCRSCCYYGVQVVVCVVVVRLIGALTVDGRPEHSGVSGRVERIGYSGPEVVAGHWQLVGFVHAFVEARSAGCLDAGAAVFTSTVKLVVFLLLLLLLLL